MGHKSSLSEEIRTGAEIQKITFIDENGKIQKKIAPREKIAQEFNKIYADRRMKWIELKNIRGIRGKILKTYFEYKEIMNKTCHFGPLDKKGDH